MSFVTKDSLRATSCLLSAVCCLLLFFENTKHERPEPYSRVRWVNMRARLLSVTFKTCIIICSSVPMLRYVHVFMYRIYRRMRRWNRSIYSCLYKTRKHAKRKRIEENRQIAKVGAVHKRLNVKFYESFPKTIITGSPPLLYDIFLRTTTVFCGRLDLSQMHQMSSFQCCPSPSME